ncbi:MAG TPA: hypothetical protein VFM96_11160 [Gaiellaceae bacterium]|nr:hypothetical protein [Gaiellaceae bacterium]
MHRPLLRIERAIDSRVRDELVTHLSYDSSRGPEERQRSAGPGQDADIHMLGQFCEEIPKDSRIAVTLQREVWREVPTGKMNVRARVMQLLSDRW